MFKKLKEFFKNQKGFSLMELIVVIAILGVIASIAVPNVIGAIDNARKNTDRTNAAQIARAITTARAEGVDVTASTYIEFKSPFQDIVPKYLQSAPKIQTTKSLGSDTNGKITSFYVKIDEGMVSVAARTTSGASIVETQIFPTPAGDWAD